MKAKFKVAERVRVSLPGEAKRMGTIESRPPLARPAKGSVAWAGPYLVRFESEELLLIHEKYLETPS